MIRFENVTKILGGRAVLDAMSFEIRKGETFVIVGPSGVGKSVTLKHMVRLLTPDMGRVLVGGEEVSEARGRDLEHIRDRFGYLFQNGALLAWLTVGENVALPLREKTSLGEEQIREKVRLTLGMVGLADDAEKYPDEISGGMRKRAGLARAIIRDPEIVLYDEPTSGLDPVTVPNDRRADRAPAGADWRHECRGDARSAQRAVDRDAHRHDLCREDCRARDPGGVYRVAAGRRAGISGIAIHHQAWILGREVAMKRNISFMPELSREVIVGAFMVMVLLGLGYFTIILSRETWFATKHYEQVVFKDIMGLRVGDSVVVRGMPVGKVGALALTNHSVCVNLTLEQPVQMREGYRIKIVTTSILGGRYLEIYEGPDSAPRLPAGMVYRGDEAHDLMADASAIMYSIRDSMDRGGVVTNIEQTIANLRIMSERVVSGSGTVARLLNDEGALYADLAGTAESLKNITARLDRGEGTLGRLLSGDDKLYQDLEATMAAIRSIATRIEKGEGSIGRLMQDDSLYQEVKAAVQEVRATIDDMRETTPVVGFTSIFFGAF
jgi:phospholipid/cholesterol/gamma-HCH transport system substrate-binding protein